ncbi:MAG TPA: hypothetical protein VFR86_03750 [Burkholderiaceae bacterium]|nr:hypothetical protein [Burkholderiaceae bacterium]
MAIFVVRAFVQLRDCDPRLGRGEHAGLVVRRASAGRGQTIDAHATKGGVILRLVFHRIEVSMGSILRITNVGDSIAIVLPRELLDRLQLGKDAALLVTETADGIELKPCSPEAARQLALADEIMRENQEVLRRLAA